MTGVPLPVVLGFVFVVLLSLLLLAIGSLTRKDSSRLLASRIERYGPRRAAPQAEQGAVATAAVSWASRLLRSSNAESGLAARLDLAGIQRQPAEWAVLSGAACLALGAAATLLLGSILAGLAVGVAAGWIGMRLLVSILIGRRRSAFAEQLPDILQLLAGSLQSGFSLPQALGAVVREENQPSASEFSRALAETRLGSGLEDALYRVAQRMDSVDLRWTVMAIRIQRDVGGNLAEVLRNTMTTMRERSQLRRHVRALSAEGRLSAYILLALPVAIGVYMFLVARSYMQVLYSTPVGLLMLGATGILFVIGWVWMRKIIKVEL